MKTPLCIAIMALTAAAAWALHINAETKANIVVIKSDLPQITIGFGASDPNINNGKANRIRNLTPANKPVML